MSTANNPANEDPAGEAVMAAAMRIRDTAADYDAEDNGDIGPLADAVALHTNDLEPAELEQVLVLVTIALSVQFRHPRRDHRTRDDVRIGAEAARAVVQAARAYDVDGFVDAMAIATDRLSRRQLVCLAGNLATMVAAYVAEDSLHPRSQDLHDQLVAWLDKQPPPAGA